jgi:hypothetical protein
VRTTIFRLLEGQRWKARNQRGQLAAIRLDNLTDAVARLLEDKWPESYLNIVGGRAVAELPDGSKWADAVTAALRAGDYTTSLTAQRHTYKNCAKNISKQFIAWLNKNLQTLAVRSVK